MKTSLVILSLAVPFALAACGEEAPRQLGATNSSTEEGDDEMEPESPPAGMLLPPSPSPVAPGQTATPGAITPGTTATTTPGAVTPGMVTPGAVTPGAVTGNPLTPPTAAPPAATTPPTPAATGTVTTPVSTVTPTPTTTPAALTCEAAWTVGSSGYVSAPGATTCFQGYAWASATPTASSMITPETFEACGADCQLCASGVVAATADFSGVALLGFNVAQLESTDTTMTVTPTGSISLNVTNPGGSPLRVQLNGTSTQWCKDISGMSGDITIPLTDFSAECWEGGAMTAYSGGAIEAIVLLVPGSDVEDTMFDICLNSVTPG